MTTVRVDASKSYDIKIGRGILGSLGQELKALGKIRTVCIVSETTVYPLHGEAAKKSLEDSGFSVVSFVFPAGEASKNGQVFLQLLGFLAESGLTRSDAIVALGGGVVGDLAGFAAATYQRGIRFVQVPTTLLSAVDSSVGGKTAIDLPTGKNMAGAFYQPSFVLCDTDCLSSLPMDIFRDGCAEVIKYGILYDREFFYYLSRTGVEFDREKVITRCVELKRDVVNRDEFDTGERMKLNLGHTVGHGVEAGSSFTLSHGKSVAIGMAIVSRAACKCGLLNEKDCDTIVKTIEFFGLPVKCDFTAPELATFALHDKKRSGSTVSLIIPTAIGHCDIVPTETEKLSTFIESGL